MRWHRKLVAQHHTYQNENGSRGRPPLSQAIVDLVVQIARENPLFGCDRIQGELKKLNHAISDTSVENILRANGIDPAPDRKVNGNWKEFLAAHMECLAATDFTTVDVWTPKGLKTVYLLFVMQIATRKVQFLGCTARPSETWMLQAAERATSGDGILAGPDHPTVLLMDRDSKFTAAFQQRLEAKEIKPHVLPPRSPNLNAFMERFMLTFKTELAYRMIFFGEASLKYATDQFLEDYHRERPHQGLGNDLIIPLANPPPTDGEIETTTRLGGLLKSYQRAA